MDITKNATVLAIVFTLICLNAFNARLALAQGHVQCHTSATESADAAVPSLETTTSEEGGSVTGGLGGQQWNAAYDTAYNRCMGRRGSQPSFAAPVFSGTCVERQEFVHQRCEARYRSYDRCSGTFQPFNGPRRLCQ